MNSKILKIILSILVITMCSVIFIFSSQSGKESQGISKKISNKIIETTTATTNEKTKLSKVNKIIRKCAHFSLYMVLGICVMLLLNSFEIKNTKQIVITLLFGVIYALSDEFHQSFTPDRTPSILDVMIDSFGIIIGICIVLIIIKIIKNRKEKYSSNAT